MRYGVISDIHGNLEAFRVALDALSAEKIDKYLCVGDIVGYGADPAECIKETRKLDCEVVLGNHDAAAAGLTEPRNFNEAARKAVIWTRKILSAEDIAYLKGLGVLYKNEHVTLAHGTLQDPGEFHYMTGGAAAAATFDLMETKICFVGHSHVPGVFACKGDTMGRFYGEKINVSEFEKVIINAGSIGQPRDKDPRLCYCVYDTEKNEAELKRLPYDVRKAQGKILDAGLPKFLAERLADGR